MSVLPTSLSFTVYKNLPHYGIFKYYKHMCKKGDSSIIIFAQAVER